MMIKQRSLRIEFTLWHLNKFSILYKMSDCKYSKEQIEEYKKILDDFKNRGNKEGENLYRTCIPQLAFQTTRGVLGGLHPPIFMLNLVFIFVNHVIHLMACSWIL